ncbi:hypothetical protein TRVL_07159 [Trypanosoma vivax]|nr:hypothetical protein TRVL_07159 [Trypanosoma vivax]
MARALRLLGKGPRSLSRRFPKRAMALRSEFLAAGCEALSPRKAGPKGARGFRLSSEAKVAGRRSDSAPSDSCLRMGATLFGPPPHGRTGRLRPGGPAPILRAALLTAVGGDSFWSPRGAWRKLRKIHFSQSREKKKRKEQQEKDQRARNK